MIKFETAWPNQIHRLSDTPRIYKKHIEAARFDDLKSWHPVNTGGLQNYSGNATSLELIRQSMQVLCKCAKRAHGFVISIY